MRNSPLTRRSALAAILLAVPGAALATPRAGRIVVDVSALRRDGDNTDADFLAEVLPGYLSQAFGPGRSVVARIESVSYGVPGSIGHTGGNGAVDTIEGVAVVDGRTVPLFCSLVTSVSLPDVGGYGARMRQDQLARSFAQWLPRQAGL
jgi:hypothetical protein